MVGSSPSPSSGRIWNWLPALMLVPSFRLSSGNLATSPSFPSVESHRAGLWLICPWHKILANASEDQALSQKYFPVDGQMGAPHLSQSCGSLQGQSQGCWNWGAAVFPREAALASCSEGWTHYPAGQFAGAAGMPFWPSTLGSSRIQTCFGTLWKADACQGLGLFTIGAL